MRRGPLIVTGLLTFNFNLARMALLYSTSGLGGFVGRISVVAYLLFKMKMPFNSRWPAVKF